MNVPGPRRPRRAERGAAAPDPHCYCVICRWARQLPDRALELNYERYLAGELIADVEDEIEAAQ